MMLDSKETKEKILSEFLTICEFDGWTLNSLIRAVKNAGIDEKFLPLIFENDVLDIAKFYIQSQNEKSAKVIFEIDDFHAKKIRDKIRISLYSRFEIEKDHKIILQRLINFYLNPKNFLNLEIGVRPLFQGMKACYEIADFIWKVINDQSTDFNFYTKRATLAKIILRSLLVFLKDESNDLQKTKMFIDSQIEAVMRFEKKKSQVKKFFSEVKNMSEKAFLDENGLPKSPKNLIKDLPFFRLIKFKR